METIEVIDVQTIVPRMRHPYIFEKIDALLPGDSFVIVNDHDPQPLYYQLLAERGPIVNWEYLEKGPLSWRVKITRAQEKNKVETIGEMVTKDIRKAKVFRKYGIDFCCGGKRSLEETCSKKNIDIEKLKKDLAAVERDHSTMPGNPDEWDLDFLAGYIVNIHHKYVRNTVPVLLAWSQKVANVHGGTHPEAVPVAQLFAAVAEELMSHMEKEEHVLFPYITGLANATRDNKTPKPAGFGTVKNPIRMMEHEHESVGRLFTEIEQLSNGFTPPADACNTYRALYATLKEFEDDLFLHIHLENNILFPKAAALEEELQK